jgi:hypothetical protein
MSESLPTSAIRWSIEQLDARMESEWLESDEYKNRERGRGASEPNREWWETKFFYKEIREQNEQLQALSNALKEKQEKLDNTIGVLSEQLTVIHIQRARIAELEGGK